MKHPEMMHWSEAEHPPPISCSSSDDDVPLPPPEETPRGLGAMSRRTVVVSVVVVALVLFLEVLICAVVLGGAVHAGESHPPCAYVIAPACPLRYSDFLTAVETIPMGPVNATHADVAMLMTVLYDYAVGAEVNAARAACTGGVVDVPEASAMLYLRQALKDFSPLFKLAPGEVEVFTESAERIYSIARGKTCPLSE